MTTLTWSTTRDTIHVNGDPSAPLDAALAAGALVKCWSLAGIRNSEELDVSAATEFAFPYPSSGLDGLQDLLSDLAWLGVEQGVLLVIDAKGALDSIVRDVASILPGVAGSWRSQLPPFEVYLIGVDNLVEVASILENQNAKRDALGRLEWTRDDIARIPVIIHS